ncbi:hypothetical protein PIROE2DRAFT_58681 [Piromyces sp. E2]|nr:hypothetical protein PIROE2DRAFT_58681 [Piromyces sp. E2]|eukprot:OUM67540.1 hypothetical protein PIROE2DRAFT_58681 [Piromyces sp. E2]
MNNILFFILVVQILLIFCYGKNPDHDIVILYTNDVHCAVDDTIGYAGLSYYKKEVEKRTPYVSLVDAGDAVQGATVGSISKGIFIIDIMNSIPYDLAIPGNHEFDYGMDQFNLFSKNLSCSYLSCNFRNIITGELVFEPYQMISYGNVKVAYVGISTPESIVKSSPASFMDDNNNYIFDFDGDVSGEKLYNSVQKAVDDARSNGADYVIAVGHLGESIDVTEPWSSISVVKNTKGIDAFIDGHSHEVVPSLIQKNIEGKDVPITQSGSKLTHIGQVTISTNGSIKTELIDAENIKEKDEMITSVIEKIKDKYKESINKYLTYADFNLEAFDEMDMRIIRKNETNIANLVSDAILYESRKFGSVDIAFCNGGNIRESLKKGNITINDVITVLPFTSSACISKMSGQTILDALEISARKYPNYNGGFLHPAGLTYVIDPEINSTVEMDEKNVFLRVSGERRVHSVLVNGEPLDPNRQYIVAASSYILREYGDGYVFAESEIINPDFAILSDLLINYLSEMDSIPEKYRFSQGRVTFGKLQDSKETNKFSKRDFNIVMEFEGLDDLLFNEVMKVGTSKEFPFRVTKNNEAFSEPYSLSITVTPESSNENVSEFIFDKNTNILKLLAKENGKAEIGITYTAKLKIISSGENISDTKNVEINRKLWKII